MIRELIGGLPVSDDAEFDSFFVGLIGLHKQFSTQIDISLPAFVTAQSGLRAARMAELMICAGIGTLNGLTVADLYSTAIPVLRTDQSIWDAYKNALKTMPYEEYLTTVEWRDVRTIGHGLAGKACQVCNKKSRLDVHHRTYENRGWEKYCDVTVLCRACHASQHGKEA